MVNVRQLHDDGSALGREWDRLARDVDSLDEHRKSVRQEWLDLEHERERLREERKTFEDLVEKEWFTLPRARFEERSEEVVKINVGGQVFETAAGILLRDRFSLLAAVCQQEEGRLVPKDDDGCFYFDRDWWLFRYVLNFLRDGTLPEQEELLRDLHYEASFYCLTSMQRSIEVVLAERTLLEEGGVDAFRGSSSRGLRLNPSRSYRYRPTHSLAAAPLPDPFGFTKRPTRRRAERA